MAKRILVPVDGTERARQAVEFVAGQFPDATVVLLHVINPADAGYSAQASIPSFSEEWFQRERDAAEELFDEIAPIATEAGLTVEREIEVGRPTRTIVEFAADEEIDQVVMGSHCRSGVSRILLGSVAETVVRRSPVPVTVTR